MHAVIPIEYQIPILQEGTTNSKVGRVVHDVTSIEHEGILVLLDMGRMGLTKDVGWLGQVYEIEHEGILVLLEGAHLGREG